MQIKVEINCEPVTEADFGRKVVDDYGDEATLAGIIGRLVRIRYSETGTLAEKMPRDLEWA